MPQVKVAFLRKPILKAPSALCRSIQMITIYLALCGGTCFIMTALCLWDVVALVARFEALSTAVKWIARHKFQIPYILHLLDDFLIISLSRETCSQQLSVFLGICDYLGIPIAPEKTCGPATTLSFAGIELDSIRMEARLPQDKIMKCTKMLNSFIGKRLPLKSFK